jgi:anthranilate synthase component 1
VSVATGCVVERLPVYIDLLELHAAQPLRYPHLLESAVHGGKRARYDILFAFPGETLVQRAAGGIELDGRLTSEPDFLHALDQRWTRERSAEPTSSPDPAPPFVGGWFVFLAYELAGAIEPSVSELHSDSALPLAMAVRCPAALIRDHFGRCTYLVCESSLAREFLPRMREDLAQVQSMRIPAVVAAVDEDAAERFVAGVERVLEYIRAGDVFQVNLSRAWRAELREEVPAHALYGALRASNPAPFAGVMTLPGGRAVLSSSPERLIEVRRGRVSTRPIAGTYPRSDDPGQDRAWSRELLAHPKERAEHVMLIDLERNDLGRVCQPGSMQVSELMALESYRHVHHIVSEVRGRLRGDVTPGRVIRAVFPGGTITGCPKVRCMQIIAELEQAPRGAYTGSMGYLNRDGSMDLNILIRTMVQLGRHVQLRAGAGVVADSNPARELAETRAKARGMLAALGATT